MPRGRPWFEIVTDSTADIPPEMVEELGITVVPSYIVFGSETYQDGVDLTKAAVLRQADHQPGDTDDGCPTHRRIRGGISAAWPRRRTRSCRSSWSGD